MLLNFFSICLRLWFLKGMFLVVTVLFAKIWFFTMSILAEAATEGVL